MGLEPIQDVAGTRTTTTAFFHVAATNTLSIPIFRATGACVIESVRVVYGFAVTGHGANTNNINLDTRTSAYAVPTEIANIDHGAGADAVANTSIAFTGITADESALTDGMYLCAELEEVGNGLAAGLGPISFVVEWRPEE